MTIPTLILIGQIFWNSKILWCLAVGLITAFTIWTVWRIVFLRILIDYHREYVSGITWDFREVITLTTIFLILFFINWTIWKMKPNQNKHLA